MAKDKTQVINKDAALGVLIKGIEKQVKNLQKKVKDNIK